MASSKVRGRKNCPCGASGNSSQAGFKKIHAVGVVHCLLFGLAGPPCSDHCAAFARWSGFDPSFACRAYSCEMLSKRLRSEAAKTVRESVFEVARGEGRGSTPPASIAQARLNRWPVS